MHNFRHSEPPRPAGSRGKVRLPAAAVLLGLLLSVILSITPAHAGTAPHGGVRGEVLSALTGKPVSGARVTLPDFGLTARSGPDGTFSFGRGLATDARYRQIGAEVRAPGFGTWKVSGLPLRPDDTLVLHAELRNTAFTHTLIPPEQEPSKRTNAVDAGSRSALTTSGPTCTGWDYQLVPPPTIKVYRTGSGTVDTVDFFFYVSHVLPREWIPSWTKDALAAGALAVKTYAAYRAMSGHARSSGAGCSDIYDSTSDQVYDPTFTTDVTNQAVAATFGSVFYRDGGLFLAQYMAGSSSDPCAPVTGTYAGRMSQWGSQTCGKNGMSWTNIVPTFYTGTTAWNNLRSLLLNPSVSSDPMFMWQGTSATVVTRTSGVGYEGKWYVESDPKSAGLTATVYQMRPSYGGSTTQYHLTTALRCAQTGNPCAGTLKLIAHPATGKEQVRKLDVTVPNDGQWHPYSWDPAMFTISHVSVRFSLASQARMCMDASNLWAPFGV